MEAWADLLPLLNASPALAMLLFVYRLCTFAERFLAVWERIERKIPNAPKYASRLDRDLPG